jgi:hypothetical protein
LFTSSSGILEKKCGGGVVFLGGIWGNRVFFDGNWMVKRGELHGKRGQKTVVEQGLKSTPKISGIFFATGGANATAPRTLPCRAFDLEHPPATAR